MPLVRTANQQLSIGEKSYLKDKHVLTSEAHREFLLSLNLSDNFNIDSFYKKISKPVTIAIAISGGGYRSMLNGAGVLMTFDSRTENKSDLAGLLQSSTYLAGVSGGAWLVSSLISHDFKSVEELYNDENLWNFESPLLEGIPDIDFDSKKSKLDNDKRVTRKWLSSSNKFPVLAKRGTRGSIKTALEKFVQELEKLSRGISSLSAWRIREILEDYNVVPSSNHNFPVIISPENEHSDQSSSTKAEKFEFDIPKDNTNASLLDGLFNIDNLYTETLPEGANSTKINHDEDSWNKISSFYQDLHSEVRSKKRAGFKITFTDFWARALAKKLLPASKVEGHLTLSSITNATTFKSRDMPFPIILSNLRWPDVEITSINSQVFEFNPYEFGSWDSYLNAFADIRFLGSPLSKGKPMSQKNNGTSLCVSGYDDISYITAMSSSLFNNILIYIWQSVSSAKKKASAAIKIILFTFGLGLNHDRDNRNHPDFAILAPNPFFEYEVSHGSEDLIRSQHLFMVDGGEDKQNIPFHPFLQKSRAVDIIIAVDSTSDMNNLPDGTTLRATYKRYLQIQADDAIFYHPSGARGIFPRVPTESEIQEKSFNTTPKFFGCNLAKYPIKSAKNQPNEFTERWLPPLIAYFPNLPFSEQSNLSTFKLSYNKSEVGNMLKNGANILTSSSSLGVGIEAKCLGCATLKREFDRIKLGLNSKISPDSFKIPEVCKACYRKHCYS